MAQVHNAYYNSPWIAQAAQNLASALAPADPEKQLAAQRAKWMFEREQQLAQYEDQERERVANLRGAFGDLATASTGRDTIQAADPAFGALGQLASALPMGMGKGITEGLGQVQNLGDVVSGTTKDNATREAYRLGASPDEVYAVTGQKTKDAMALAGYKGDLAQVIQEMRNQGGMDRVNAQQGGANYRADAGNDLKRALNLTDNQFDLFIALAKGQFGLDAARIRGANGTGQPLDISPTDTMNLGYELEDWAAAMGVKLPPEQLYVAKTIAAKVYQDTRDSQAALDAAKMALFGNLSPTVNPGNPDSWAPNMFGIDTIEAPSFTLRGGKTAQQLLDEFNQSYKSPRAAAPAAGGVPGATSNFSESFYRTNPGMLPPGITLPGAGLPPPVAPPRVRVDANGNVIR